MRAARSTISLTLPVMARAEALARAAGMSASAYVAHLVMSADAQAGAALRTAADGMLERMARVERVCAELRDHALGSPAWSEVAKQRLREAMP